MEKTIQIEGRNVRFKCTAGTLIRYRNQFNREFLADLAKLEKVKSDNYDDFTLAPFYDVIWVMAKTADDTVPDPISWYDTFDSFPIIEVFGQLQNILIATIKVKNSSPAAVPNRVTRRRKKHR